MSGCLEIMQLNHIEIYCTVCSVDLTSVDECDAFIERERHQQYIIDAADTFNVDLDNLTKTEKKVTHPGAVVTCLYYSESYG